MGSISSHDGNVESSLLKIVELTNRVDQLEAYVREISGKLSEKIALQTENQVVNLTISKGLEDIITRVINDKISIVKDSADRVSLHSANLEVKVIKLESEVQKLQSKIEHTSSQVKEPVSPDTSLPNLTPIHSTSEKMTATTGTTTPQTVITTTEFSLNDHTSSQSDKALLDAVLKATGSPIDVTTSKTED